MTMPSETPEATHAYVIVPDDPVEAERLNGHSPFDHKWEDDTGIVVHPEDHDA